MYPGTQFAWHDESFINANTPIASNAFSPLFMVASAFDQGTENPIEIEGNDFNSMFGTMSFEKYGQISLQCQNTINAGGRLFAKRLVADDSTLANLVLAVRLSSTQKEQQKYDQDGNALYYTDETQTAETTEVTDYPVMEPVYYDEDGNETSEDTGNPVMNAVLKWEAHSVEGATNDYQSASIAVDDLVKDLNTEANVFPLICVKDNGRGTSLKSFRVNPDYNVSRGAGTVFYRAIVYNNNNKAEEKVFTLDPDIIYSNVAYRLEKETCTQVVATVNEAVYYNFLEALADITLIDTDTLRGYDLINATTNRGTLLSNIVIAEDSVDLNASTGIALQNGSNGVFGDGPMKTEDGQQALFAKMVDYYSGNITDEIYDVDTHLVACVLDAAFPNIVKEAIGELVAFRKDCFFFRDIGIGHYTFGDIYAELRNLPPIPVIDDRYATITNDESSNDNGKFFADYISSYNVRDPYTNKVIEVTMMYDMATCLVEHLENSPNVPLAGQYNNFILPSAIKGTLNFTPLNTPKVNQKQALEDIHANYAIFESGSCVVQSLYTCQTKLSQLSYINNVLAIQYVMRVVRRACPRNRFSLANGRDLSSYASAVERVLEDYKNMFSVLEFEYVQNDLESDLKLFSASIRFAFHNWAQSEYFDLYAINTPTVSVTD